LEGAEEVNEIVHAKPSSTKSWLVNVYGSRWIKRSDGSFTLATTSLERLPELHNTIVRTVLIDEHSRPSKLVAEANHERIGYVYSNKSGLQL